MSNNNDKMTLSAPLKHALGFVDLVSFDSDSRRVKLEFEAREEFLHAGGVIQGGFVTGWIDSAMAYAVHLSNDYSITPLSLELKITFLNPTLPGRVYAEAWIIKQGRAIGFLEGRLLNEHGEILATGSSSVKLFNVK